MRVAPSDNGRGRQPCFNPESPLDRNPVIPAQAGIQLIKKFPRSGPTSRLCPLKELLAIRLSWQTTSAKLLDICGGFVLLDSRLRGNDGSYKLSGFNPDSPLGLQSQSSHRRSPTCTKGRQFTTRQAGCEIDTRAIAYRAASCAPTGAGIKVLHTGACIKVFHTGAGIKVLHTGTWLEGSQTRFPRINEKSKKANGQPVKAPGQMGGFTFLGLMMIIAIMGVALLAVGEVWHSAQKREKEQALLFVGDQFRLAISLYYAHTPVASKQQPYPMNLEDLLKDPRYPSTERYLRKIYLDPISGSPEWGLARKPNGGIFGVYSLSEETPIKQGNFRLSDKEFSGKKKYAEWIFMHVPPPGSINPDGTISPSPTPRPGKHRSRR